MKILNKKGGYLPPKAAFICLPNELGIKNWCVARNHWIRLQNIAIKGAANYERSPQKTETQS